MELISVVMDSILHKFYAGNCRIIICLVHYLITLAVWHNYSTWIWLTIISVGQYLLRGVNFLNLSICKKVLPIHLNNVKQEYMALIWYKVNLYVWKLLLEKVQLIISIWIIGRKSITPVNKIHPSRLNSNRVSGSVWN